jgi:hypothetical protein
LQPLEDRLAPANFAVTSLADSGTGSLREAVALANFVPGADTITFSVSGTITLTSGEINISETLGIIGNGSTISGNNTSRIFNTLLAPPGTPIGISNLTMTNGSSNSGGAIFVGDEVLVLTDCTISNSKAVFAGTNEGGGAIIVALGGILNLTRCTLSGNSTNL